MVPFISKLHILWMLSVGHELLGGYYFPILVQKLEIIVLVRPPSDLEVQDLVF